MRQHTSKSMLCLSNCAQTFGIVFLFITLVDANSKGNNASLHDSEKTRLEKPCANADPDNPNPKNASISCSLNSLAATKNEEPPPSKPQTPKTQKPFLEEIFCFLQDFMFVRVILLALAPKVFQNLPLLPPNMAQFAPFVLTVIYPVLVMYLPGILRILFPPVTWNYWARKLEILNDEIQSNPKNFLKEKIQPLLNCLEDSFASVVLPLYYFVIWPIFHQAWNDLSKTTWEALQSTEQSPQIDLQPIILEQQ